MGRRERVLADERADGDAAELHLGGIPEVLQHRAEVARPNAGVEPLDMLTQQLAQKPHSCPPLVEELKCRALVRRRSNLSVPVPSATPARISARPPSADAVTGSSRKIAPYRSASAGTRYVTSAA